MKITVKATNDLLEAIGGTVGEAGKPIVLPTNIVHAIINKEFTLNQFLNNPIEFASKLNNTDILEK
jgi:hypothetical protein